MRKIVKWILRMTLDRLITFTNDLYSGEEGIVMQKEPNFEKD